MARFGIRGRLAQALAFHSRERTRSLRTNVSELFRTHVFVDGATIDPAVSFPAPDRTSDVTFDFRLKVTGAAPAGDVLVIGGAVNVTVTLAGPDITVHAGSAAGDGVTITATDALPATGLYDISVAVKPGTGQARLWVNGRLLAAGTSAGGDFPAGWADTTPGSYGSGLTDAAVASPLSVFTMQVPRHFHESIYT